MKRMRYAAIAVQCVAVCSCANVSPVVQTGNNSYLISVISHSQFNDATVQATSEAAAYCERLGKKVVVNGADRAGTQVMSSSSARVQFSCYAADDPAYKAAK